MPGARPERNRTPAIDCIGFPERRLRIRKRKRARHDANHRCGCSVDQDLTADDRRIACEPPSPESFAENDDIRLTRIVFVGRKHTTENRSAAEQREEIGGDRCRVETFSCGAVVKVCAQPTVCGNAGGRMQLCAQRQ